VSQMSQAAGHRPQRCSEPDNLVVNTMNRGGQVLVKEARSTVADDDVAIGEWARIGIGHLR
jgi:hypothetical protein